MEARPLHAYTVRISYSTIDPAVESRGIECMDQKTPLYRVCIRTMPLSRSGLTILEPCAHGQENHFRLILPILSHFITL